MVAYLNHLSLEKDKETNKNPQTWAVTQILILVVSGRALASVVVKCCQVT